MIVRIALAMLLVFVPATTQAVEVLKKGGFRIDVKWEAKSSEFHYWGDIRGGQYCEIIKLTGYFENKKTGYTYYGSTTSQSEHNPKFGSKFYKAKSFNTGRKRKEWVLTQLNFKCLINGQSKGYWEMYTYK